MPDPDPNPDPDPDPDLAWMRTSRAGPGRVSPRSHRPIPELETVANPKTDPNPNLNPELDRRTRTSRAGLPEPDPCPDVKPVGGPGRFQPSNKGVENLQGMEYSIFLQVNKKHENRG